MKSISRISLILSFVLFIVLCATTSFWVLQFMQPPARKISAPPSIKPVADVESVASLFGGALAVNTNYQLKGIVLANPESQSGAIISVDGKPSQAFRVNAELAPGVKLTEVHAGYIMISDKGVSKRVDLPDAKPSVGFSNPDTLPPRYPIAPPPPVNGPMLAPRMVDNAGNRNNQPHGPNQGDAPAAVIPGNRER